MEAYEFPAWRYDKILYVEKTGLWPLLKQAQIGERYDMAIVAASGYATEAARVLFDNAEKDHDYQLFVLHDADWSGYEIARTLREETERMPEHSVEVVDLGLKVEDAIARGLQEEEHTRTKALPEPLLPLLSQKELEYFEGRDAGKRTGAGNPIHLCRRVELNALSSPQLVELIDEGLAAADVRGKVVPDEEALPGLAEQAYRREVRGWVDNALAEMLCLNELKDAIADDLMGEFKLANANRYIRARFGQDETYSWDGALKDELSDIYKAKKGAVEDAVKEKVIEVLKEE